jgi:hypothetical protein
MNPAESIEERVRQRAYRIWEEEGRPEGREHEHWQRAVRDVEAQASTDAGETPTTGEAESKLPPLPTD